MAADNEMEKLEYARSLLRGGTPAEKEAAREHVEWVISRTSRMDISMTATQILEEFPC